MSMSYPNKFHREVKNQNKAKQKLVNTVSKFSSSFQRIWKLPLETSLAYDRHQLKVPKTGHVLVIPLTSISHFPAHCDVQEKGICTVAVREMFLLYSISF